MRAVCFKRWGNLCLVTELQHKPDVYISVSFNLDECKEACSESNNNIFYSTC